MTVGELESRMSASEYRNWLKFWEHEAGHRQTMGEAIQELSKWQR
jgi:hypothetical protein